MAVGNDQSISMSAFYIYIFTFVANRGIKLSRMRCYGAVSFPHAMRTVPAFRIAATARSHFRRRFRGSSPRSRFLLFVFGRRWRLTCVALLGSPRVSSSFLRRLLLALGTPPPPLASFYSLAHSFVLSLSFSHSSYPSYL